MMGDAGQDQKQSQLARFGHAEGSGKADVGGHLFERVEQTEDMPAFGIGQAGGVDLAAQEAAQGVNARARPGGDVGDGAVLDLAVFAVRLADEDGGGRGAIGDFRHVHEFSILQLNNTYMQNVAYYMTTQSFAINKGCLK